jgi:hypothetical protein
MLRMMLVLPVTVALASCAQYQAQQATAAA